MFRVVVFICIVISFNVFARQEAFFGLYAFNTRFDAAFGDFFSTVRAATRPNTFQVDNQQKAAFDLPDGKLKRIRSIFNCFFPYSRRPRFASKD